MPVTQEVVKTPQYHFKVIFLMHTFKTVFFIIKDRYGSVPETLGAQCDSMLNLTHFQWLKTRACEQSGHISFRAESAF